VRAFIAEYTDRRGTLIWATAEQLTPALRVAIVVVASVMLSGVAFAASAPRAATQPRARATAPLGSGRTPSASGPIRPRTSSRLPSRREHAQTNGAAVVTQRGKTRQPTSARSSTTPTQPLAPTLPSLRPSPGQRTVGPTAATPSPIQSTPVALTPHAATAYSQLGGSLTNPHDVGVLTTTPQTQPPPPTTTTIPTAPTAPPTSPTPAPPTEPTSPTPPSNPDQCKTEAGKRSAI
jgi:hypothetical protein